MIDPNKIRAQLLEDINSTNQNSFLGMDYADGPDDTQNSSPETIVLRKLDTIADYPRVLRLIDPSVARELRERQRSVASKRK
jgi:hypothetical protein